jgi:hypothetical protein
MVVACTRTSGHAIGGRSFAVVHRHDANAAPAHVVLPSVTLDHLRAGNGCRAKPTRRCRWAWPTYAMAGAAAARPVDRHAWRRLKQAYFAPCVKRKLFQSLETKALPAVGRLPYAPQTTRHAQTDAHSQESVSHRVPHDHVKHQS